MAISSKLLNEGEKVILSMRQHPKALFAPILLLVLLLAVGVLVQALIDDDVANLIAWVAVAIGIVWYCLRPFLLWLVDVHAITDRRIITRQGIVTRRGHDIPLSRISDVAIEINLIDRPFGCGTLVISDAATQGIVRLHDIPRVEKTKLTLHSLIHEVQDGPTRAADGS